VRPVGLSETEASRSMRPTICSPSAIFRRAGTCEQVFWWTFLVHLALVHEDQFCADVAGEPHLVRDEDERHAVPGELLDHA
jgi:hypothetical protein